ncbi:unnamed protein product, partial [marine sediment metagenome]
VVSLLVEGLSGIAEVVYGVNSVCRLICTSSLSVDLLMFEYDESHSGLHRPWVVVLCLELYHHNHAYRVRVG